MTCGQSLHSGTGRPEPSGNETKGENIESSYGRFSGIWQSIKGRIVSSHKESDENFQEMERSLVFLEHVGAKCQEMMQEKKITEGLECHAEKFECFSCGQWNVGKSFEHMCSVRCVLERSLQGLLGGSVG